MSETQHVVWAPRPQILYHRIGNRNYQILDPASEEETPLVKNESVGWLFEAALSPDGTKLAVFWNRQPDPGLWIISLEDRSERFSGARGVIYPLGWSPDGRWAYGQKEEDEDYLRIDPESLRIEPLPSLAFMIEGEPHRMPLGEKTRIVINRKSQSDVWVIENFDRLVR